MRICMWFGGLDWKAYRREYKRGGSEGKERRKKERKQTYLGEKRKERKEKGREVGKWKGEKLNRSCQTQPLTHSRTGATSHSGLNERRTGRREKEMNRNHSQAAKTKQIENDSTNCHVVKHQFVGNNHPMGVVCYPPFGLSPALQCSERTNKSTKTCRQTEDGCTLTSGSQLNSAVGLLLLLLLLAMCVSREIPRPAISFRWVLPPSPQRMCAREDR